MEEESPNTFRKASSQPSDAAQSDAQRTSEGRPVRTTSVSFSVCENDDVRAHTVFHSANGDESEREAPPSPVITVRKNKPSTRRFDFRATAQVKSDKHAAIRDRDVRGKDGGSRVRRRTRSDGSALRTSSGANVGSGEGEALRYAKGEQVATEATPCSARASDIESLRRSIVWGVGSLLVSTALVALAGPSIPFVLGITSLLALMVAVLFSSADRDLRNAPKSSAVYSQSGAQSTGRDEGDRDELVDQRGAGDGRDAHARGGHVCGEAVARESAEADTTSASAESAEEGELQTRDMLVALVEEEEKGDGWYEDDDGEHHQEEPRAIDGDIVECSGEVVEQRGAPRLERTIDLPSTAETILRMWARRFRFVRRKHAEILIASWWRMRRAVKFLEAMKSIRKLMIQGPAKGRTTLLQRAIRSRTINVGARGGAALKVDFPILGNAVMPTRRRSSVALVELQELVLPTQDVSVRVGWQGPNNLLDAAVLSFRFEEHLEDVYFYKPRAYDGAVMHVGGYQYSLRKQREVLHEDVDHEEVVLHLEKIPLKVNTLIVLTSPAAAAHGIREAYVRLIDCASGEEFCRYDLADAELNGIRVLCKLSRLGCSAWNVTALGETIQHDGTSYSYKAVSRGVLPYLQDTPRKRKLEAIVHHIAFSESLCKHVCVHVVFDTANHVTKAGRVLPARGVAPTASAEEDALELVISSSESDEREKLLGMLPNPQDAFVVSGIAAPVVVKGSSRWLELVIVEATRSKSTMLVGGTVGKMASLAAVGKSGKHKVAEVKVLCEGGENVKALMSLSLRTIAVGEP